MSAATPAPWSPTPQATVAYRTFPSDYEWVLLERWVRSFLDTPADYEARLALNVMAQRKHLASLFTESEARRETST